LNQRFLIFTVTGIGNLILKTPMLKKIKELWPDAIIDIIERKSTFSSEILSEKLIHSRFTYNSLFPLKKHFQLFSKIKHIEYDWVIIPFDSSPSILLFISLFISANKIIHDRIHGKKIKVLLKWLIILNNVIYKHKYTFVFYKENRHEIDLNYDLLDTLSEELFNRDFGQQIFVQNTNIIEEENIFKHLTPKRYWVVQTSSANGANTVKNWPQKHYISLIQMLLNNKNNVVVTGDINEVEYNKKITDKFTSNKVLDISGKFSLSQVIEIINNSKGLICPDSGLMHVADALNIPTIALYGPTDYERTRPVSENSIVLRSNRDCLGCLKNPGWDEENTLKKCPYDIACMDEIEPKEVFKTIMQFHLD